MVETPLVFGGSQILTEVEKERRRQLELCGEQHWPDGNVPGNGFWQAKAAALKAANSSMAEIGAITWQDILFEEVAEAFAEALPNRIREELIQVAAVAVAWVEDIDSRPPGKPPRTPRDYLGRAFA